MSKSNFTILVCCHKKDFCYNGEGYLPIQVGKSNTSVDLGITGDDSGDNISNKNPNFCELTAQYWLWKNPPSTQFIGLNHYRRYFDYKKQAHGSYFFQNFSPVEIKESTLEIPDNLEDIFKDHDVILAEPITYPYSLLIHYCIQHNKTDLAELRDTISVLYPDYLSAFDKVMHGNKCSLCNMFIMRKEDFFKYSTWLFNILFTLEERINISQDSYQSRVFGFMAERLLNVYIYHNNLNPKYYPIIMVDNKKKLNKIKGIIKNKLYNLSYAIIKNSDNARVRLSDI